LPGMRLVAIANRHLDDAERAWRDGSIEHIHNCRSAAQLEAAVERHQPAISEDALALCQADGIDVVIEATGQIEFGARIALEAIKYGKHVVLMNAELDATLGPILKVHAQRAGVVLTNVDGDEPGVAMNLLRFVRTIGYQPVMAGNIKGFINPHRN